MLASDCPITNYTRHITVPHRNGYWRFDASKQQKWHMVVGQTYSFFYQFCYLRSFLAWSIYTHCYYPLHYSRLVPTTPKLIAQMCLFLSLPSVSSSDRLFDSIFNPCRFTRYCTDGGTWARVGAALSALTAVVRYKCCLPSVYRYRSFSLILLNVVLIYL